ncbi:protein translocase subunit SecF [candidate division WOR-3 bacterium]|uniref:Protein-export membrane protein SecF n=1 Tax=candidate division WOR-3 bacterium TaxID=2052148 RepID=A0A660SJ95_UNCW3|nr:MAG: protein translocase subunit SecF [candidate division WOR-3 bacterium]
MLELIKRPNIDFIGNRKKGFLLSLLLVLVAIGAILFIGPHFGVDFTGGALIQVKFERPITTDELRKALDRMGKGRASIQKFGGENEFIIRAETKEDPAKFARDVGEILKLSFKENPYKIQRQETVAPKIGGELKFRTMIAIILALLLILGYVSIRFDYRFGTAALIALFHDFIITFGLLVVLGREFTIPVVAALLTIVGYSINDSIVVSDRIRENLRKMRKETFDRIVNQGINDTLSRTLLTSLTTLTAVAMLIIFGGPVIADFAITLFIGFVIGTYSSIFIVAPIVVEWENRAPLRRR